MFCRKCGKPLPENSRFCPACGTPVAFESDAKAAPPNGSSALYALTIDRASQVYLVNPPVKVTIDNSIRLTVENGHTQTVQIPAGDHNILFKYSFRSTQIDVTITRDTTIELRWNRVTGKLDTRII